MPVVSDINADKYQSAGRHQTIRRQTSENSILERKRDNPAAFGGIQNLSPVRAIPQLSGQKGPSNLRTLRPKGRSNLRTFLHNPSTQPAASAASLCAQRAEKTSEPGREAAFDKGAIMIEDILKKYPFIVLDGAFFTEQERQGFSINDELWSAIALYERPDLVKAVHRSYFDAGSDIVNCRMKLNTKTK